MSYSLKMVSSPTSHSEVLTECLIETMKTEEQRMEKELEFMKHGEDRMKYEIRLMKYREMRMEEEIALMKRYELRMEEAPPSDTSIEDEENNLKTEGEDLKRNEEHVTYEIKRMKQYKMRLESEIRSMKYQIERGENRRTVMEIDFGNTENDDELQQIRTQLTNRENEPKQLRDELTKREMRLTECVNELHKRQVKLEQYRLKRIGCENEQNNLREKMKKKKEHIQQQIQRQRDAIKRRQDYQKELKQLRTNRIQRELEISKEFSNDILSESELMKDYKISKETTLHLVLRLRGLPIGDSITRFLSEDLDNIGYSIKYVPEKQMVCAERRHLIDFLPSLTRINDEISGIIEQPKYDIFISYTYQDDSIIGRIKDALPQWYSMHTKGTFSSRNIKTCLDNTNTAVIAIINKFYEIGKTCQADMIHIFKRQFPLVLLVNEDDFKPSTDWLNLIWNAPNIQKVFSNRSNFEENLRNACENAQWNLPPNLNMSNLLQTTTMNRSNRFSGDLYKSIIVCSDPEKMCENYRQCISDPLCITTDKKLRDFYYNYIRMYFENSDVMNLFEKGVNENNMRHFIQAYTYTGSFSATLNCHLAANLLFYFQSTLTDTVDYQLIKSLIDFVALCIYRPELQPYLFTGTVYRGMIMSSEDLVKHIVGSRLMNTTFLSASKDKKVAELFSGRGQEEFAVLCTYVTQNINNRRTALDISSISLFPHEREVLILPLSAFYVQSVTESSDYSKPIEITLVEDHSDILENVENI